MMANFKRGRGDMMGTAGALNDNADITAPVFAYWPNDYGLYNMGGNVSEWVMDVYRPLSPEDNNDFRAFRGNVFQTQVRDEEGNIAEKDSLGKIKWRDVEVDKDNLVERRNYKKADNINYLDGETITQAGADWTSAPDGSRPESMGMYEFGAHSMINDKARVYKGASWKDKAYYMSPGTRRYLDEKQSTDAIGFRCAMVRVGSPRGL
jgi:formylglycine-generating enzyme required for sulfatase activity